MTSPTAERKPKTPAKVPLPSKIDAFFGKAGKPAAKAVKRKVDTASEGGSSDLEIVESPAKRKKVVIEHEAEGGEEEVQVVTKEEGEAVKVEERGVQAVENPA